jgi:hypothetical protein
MPAAKKSKWAIVRQFQAKGLDSPTEISAEAKKIGYDISPGYVSLLKVLAKKALERQKAKEKAMAKEKLKLKSKGKRKGKRKKKAVR